MSASAPPPPPPNPYQGKKKHRGGSKKKKQEQADQRRDDQISRAPHEWYEYLERIAPTEPDPPTHQHKMIFIWRSSGKEDEYEMALKSAQWTATAITTTLTGDPLESHFVHLDAKASEMSPPKVDHESTGKYQQLGEAISQANLPKGTKVDIVVRSWSGFTTNFSALRGWVRDLTNKREIKLRFFFHDMTTVRWESASGLVGFMKPVKQGRAGYLAELPVAALLEVPGTSPANPFLVALEDFWVDLNASKAGAGRGPACPKNRNILTVEDGETMIEEMLWAAAV